MKLNEKLMKLRKERGLSQEEFGNEINVSRQAVSKWETGTTKPDIEKIKEISNYFDVSFEYLLNDDIEKFEEKESKSKTVKKKHTILKILLIIFIIYFIWSAYKFIALFRYYKIADSFSEENYTIFESDAFYQKYDSGTHMITTDKIGNKIISCSYTNYSDENAIRDENGELIALGIDFYDYDKKLAYYLNYDENTKTYTYYDTRENYTTEDWERIFSAGNMIKERTLGSIPSSFKEIMLCSINPIYQVNVITNTIYVRNFNGAKQRIILNNDCLVSAMDLQTEFDGGMSINISYDYVPGHFEGRQIKDPVEIYKDQISNYSEIEYVK